MLAEKSRSRVVHRLVLSAALLVGFAAAVYQKWLTDDAYITFRYAANLVDGHGLVFNIGEYVEGYTNFSWTILMALGLWLGATIEGWAHVWSIFFYLASIALLGSYTLRHRRDTAAKGAVIPVAAIGAALHVDWSGFATGGLETSMFIFLVLAGFMILIGGALNGRRLVPAALVFALATMTRPDGIFFAFLAGLWVLWSARSRIVAGALYGAAFFSLYAPFVAWRLWYYGEFFPNTYYAKSGDLSWYSQGIKYAYLYYLQYWILLAAPLAVLALLVHRRLKGRPMPPWMPQALLALLFILGYTAAIVRVGGDFMFARLLLPTAPFALILLEILFVEWVSRRNRWIRVEVLAIIIAAMVFTPPPVTDTLWRWGVSNERMIFSEAVADRLDRKGEILERYLQGLPVRIGYFGMEARVVYRTTIPTAIECETGLTDYYIAHQKITERKRPGHEKRAPADYLITRRKTHFTFSPNEVVLELDRYIPRFEIRLPDSEGRVLRGRILHWDPEMMAALKARGAEFQDFPAFLDGYLETLERENPRQVQDDLAKFRAFYFDHNDDPQRLARITGYLKSRGYSSGG